VIPLMAWGTRSDLTTVEGTIPEDSNFGPTLGGQAGFLTELTSTCDTSTSSSRGVSIFAIGLGLSETSQASVYTLQNQKFEALQQTVSTASITGTVQSTLATDINAAEGYVTTAQGGGDFTSNINCALNKIAATDSYLRSNLPAFASNLIMGAPGGGNPNPAGDIDGRLANWYLTLNTELAGNTPNATWPATNVPMCSPVATEPQITSFFLQPPSAGSDAGYIDWTTNNTATASSCNLTDIWANAFYVGGVTQGYTADGLPSGSPGQNFEGFDITVAFPAYPVSEASPYGVDTYTLTCYGPPGTTPAVQSMLVGVSTPAVATPPNPQLMITSFTAELGEDGNDNGNLSWGTSNSTANTVCTITDAYGGVPYDQYPLSGLPANAAGSFYGWFCGTALIGSQSLPAEPSDTLTLTCSDPNNGTAFTMLTITNPDGCNIE
jgi:hypothetical protein